MASAVDAADNDLLQVLDAAKEMQRIGNDLADYLSVKAHAVGLTQQEKAFLGAWDVPAFKVFARLEKAYALAAQVQS